MNAAQLLAGGPLDPEAQRYDVGTGAELDTAAGPDGAALLPALAPPRYCGVCRRRMIVQVRPDGWWARCSRHGPVDSADLELR